MNLVWLTTDWYIELVALHYATYNLFEQIALTQSDFYLPVGDGMHHTLL